ncbi:helix-turn-helix domain-containing protein [Gloeothece verrucosa]|uniref:Transcriptional regulator, XRE family n=1 Tax=Gloeothece verrucosa (strain PCC 7822) TaxID=497965 RepID=E0U933_GLOV7|nr:helix-turn-helix transcriptional regulator [Gloeothece verrucosa]ADN16172.1 transcriptional regulator, XRE family [Gloeothece verrucosa PCC 7822]
MMSTHTLINLEQPKVGQLIRALRQEMQLTQEQFAGMVGVVFTTVNRWEKGHANPSPMALKIIAMKLDELGEKGRDLREKYDS